MKSLAQRGDMVAQQVEYPCWTDLLGEVIQDSLTYEPFRDTHLSLRFLQYNTAANLCYAFQLPHEWDFTTAIRPHIHFVPCAPMSVQRTFAMKGWYTWALRLVEIPPQAGWTPFSASIVLQPSNVYNHMTLGYGSVQPPGGAAESSIFLLHMERDLTNDTYTDDKPDNTPAANIGILSVDVHYQKSKQGTQGEFR